jgi:hypothetical protein
VQVARSLRVAKARQTIASQGGESHQPGAIRVSRRAAVVQSFTTADQSDHSAFGNPIKVFSFQRDTRTQ